MLEVTQQPRQLFFTWPGWRLEFGWQTDRWQHALWQAQSDGWTRCIVSTEGTADQPWPDCPAFQNAYVERINTSCAEIQLLGQSGKNHYSGAVRCDADQQVIDFDLAVRIQAQHATPLLLSTYQIVHAGGLPDFRTRWELTTEALAEQPPIVADWTTDPIGAGTVVCLRMPDLTEMRAEKLRATLRWKYQWRLSQPQP